jgi:TRAP-type C4-dicarboxylate transport system permease small subunit
VGAIPPPVFFIWPVAYICNRVTAPTGNEDKTVSAFFSVFGWLDRNLEKSIILVSYVTMAGIIFVEVIRRFLFSVQAAWSTTIPIYLFLFVTWMGAAYCAKNRTHLSFSEVRTRLPYKGQFACLILDAVSWISLAVIVIVYAIEQVIIAYDNFAIVQGTDDVLMWWFFTATPIGWTLLIFRTLQNLWADLKTFWRGDPFVLQHSIVQH